MTDTWTTRDGRIIPIREMEDDHLLKTIVFLRRRSHDSVSALAWKRAMGALNYAATAPMHAADAAESEADHTMTRAGHDCILAEKLLVFRSLLEETHRRKLSLDE